MTQMKNTLGILFGLLLFWPSTILAADVVSGASPSVQTAGTDSVSIWITGSGFEMGATVSVSGNGITELRAPQLVPEEQRVDGGRGDGIIYTMSIGRRNARCSRCDGDRHLEWRPGKGCLNRCCG